MQKDRNLLGRRKGSGGGGAGAFNLYPKRLLRTFPSDAVLFTSNAVLSGGKSPSATSRIASTTKLKSSSWSEVLLGALHSPSAIANPSCATSSREIPKAAAFGTNRAAIAPPVAAVDCLKLSARAASNTCEMSFFQR